MTKQKICHIIVFIFLTLPFFKVYAQSATDSIGPLSCTVFVASIEQDERSNNSVILLNYLTGYLSGFIGGRDFNGVRSLKLPDQFTQVIYFKSFCPQNSKLNISTAANLAAEIMFLDMKKK